MNRIAGEAWLWRGRKNKGEDKEAAAAMPAAISPAARAPTLRMTFITAMFGRVEDFLYPALSEPAPENAQQRPK
jgi:hypothetical protein